MSLVNNKTIEVTYKGMAVNIALQLDECSDTWIVGLHGIQSNKSLYKELFMQPFLKSYSKLSIDFVGFGESDKPDYFLYKVDEQADIVLQILKQLGIRKLHLIGHSLGGMVGTLLIEKLRDSLLSFTNLEGNLTYLDCGVSRIVAEFEEGSFVKTGYKSLFDRIKVGNNPSSALRLRALKLVPARVLYKTSLSIVEWSKSKKLNEIFNNTTVKRQFVYGSENANKASRVSDSVKKVEIPKSGHFMTLDNPASSYKAIEKFISQYSPAPTC
jgi:pimeloyl-ACP methyl ester carboxylesterase